MRSHAPWKRREPSSMEVEDLRKNSPSPLLRRGEQLRTTTPYYYCARLLPLQRTTTSRDVLLQRLLLRLLLCYDYRCCYVLLCRRRGLESHARLAAPTDNNHLELAPLRTTTYDWQYVRPGTPR